MDLFPAFAVSLPLKINQLPQNTLSRCERHRRTTILQSSPSFESSEPTQKDAPNQFKGPGWVRRASLTRGRSLSAETVEWSVPDMHEEPANTLEACVWEASRIVDDVRLRVPFLDLMARVKRRDEADPLFRGRGIDMLDSIRQFRDSQRSKENFIEKKLGFILRMNGTEFDDDDEREIVLRGLQEDFLRDDTMVGVGVGTLGEKGIAQHVQEGETNWLMRELRESTPDVKVVALEVIGMPYQIARARLNGADALFLLAAIFPKKDLEYVARMTQKLGMLAIVECHNLEELDMALEIKEVQAVLLVRRDLHTLEGTLDGFQEMFNARKDRLKARNVAVFAEGKGTRMQDRVEGKADVLILIPEPKLDEETLKKMYDEKKMREAKILESRQAEVVKSSQ